MPSFYDVFTEDAREELINAFAAFNDQHPEVPIGDVFTLVRSVMNATARATYNDAAKQLREVLNKMDEDEGSGK